MWGSVISFFLKNFGWISVGLKWIKGFFNPLSIAILIVVALLGAGNYYFYKKTIYLKEQIQVKEKNIEDLNRSATSLKEDVLKKVSIFKKKEKEFNTTLWEIENIHKKQLKKEREYAKQKEKNNNLEDGVIAPVLRSALYFLFKGTGTTNTKNNGVRRGEAVDTK